MRLVGAGNPPWHRFRVGLEFVFSGRREFDGMIAQHAKLARTLADQLELPAPVSEAVGAAYEQWDGRGWPGILRADAIPMAARLAQLAEFTEVAHRVGGIAGAVALARRQAGRQAGKQASSSTRRWRRSWLRLRRTYSLTSRRCPRGRP